MSVTPPHKAEPPPERPRSGRRARWPRFRAFYVGMALLWAVAAFHQYAMLTHVSTAGAVPALPGFDDNCYFAFGRSLLMDGDWDFRNEYHFIASTQPESTAEPFRDLLSERPGAPPNFYAPGTGLAAVPFLAIARGTDWLIARATRSPDSSPFAPIYPFAFLLSGITWGMLSVVLTRWLVRAWLPREVASAATAAALLCGPTIFYIVYAPGMSHATAAFFVAATLLAWTRWRSEPSARHATAWALLAGLCAGFAVSVRATNVVLALPLAEPLFTAMLARRNSTAPGRNARLLQSAAMVVAGLIGTLPLLLAWRVLYGSWFANPLAYTMEGWPVHALQVLVARRHGLFFWAPAYLIALVGLLMALRRHRALVAAAAMLPALALLYGYWPQWWLGASFGMRGFVDLWPVFALGFGGVLTATHARWGWQGAPRKIAWEIVVLFAIINLHLIISFRGGVTFVDGPLYWLDTVSYGRSYKSRLNRDWLAYHDFRPDMRHPLRQARFP